MNYSLIEREEQDFKKINYQLTSFRNQNSTSVSLGRVNGHLPPSHVDADSQLRHSVQRKMLYQPETSEIRTDCYTLTGDRNTQCALPFGQHTDQYIVDSTPEVCAFTEHLKGTCTPQFWQSTTVASLPHLPEHTIEPFIRGGMNARHFNRSSDLQNKRGNIREIKFKH